MGLLNKIKDILFEEETVEIPVVSQKEEIRKIQEELKKEKEKNVSKEFSLPKEKIEETPKVLEHKIEDVSEKDLYKSEPTFPFPLAFDEEPVIPSRSKISVNTKREEKPKKEKKEKVKKQLEKIDFETKKEERNSTPFRPSPVISPVYGILDKNYKKEDLVERHRNRELKMDIDRVREKAFGDTLKPTDLQTEDIFVETEDGKTVDELLIDTLSINIENINKEEKPKKEKQEEKVVDNAININKKREPEKKNENKSIEDIEDTLETDLFNLIDSMYDQKEGE